MPWFINDSDCEESARVVWRSEFLLERGCRVVLHCRHGHHRTGVAIYLLLHSILENSAQCLSLVKEMRPEMRDQIVLHTREGHLLTKAETNFASP